MSQVKVIFKNMSWLVISQIIASICGFIWTILMARYLGVSDYGIIGFAIAFSGILSLIVDFGIGTHIVRHIATDRDVAPKYLGNAIPLKSLFACVTFILTLIILIMMRADETTIIVTLLFTLEMVFKSFIGLLNGSFQAFEEGKYQGIGNTMASILLLVFILIAIFTDLGIYGISIAYVLSHLVVLIYEYLAFKRHIVVPKFEFDKSFCKEITILSIPFAATGILYSIYYSIDIVMLTNIVGNYASGIYSATYKLISVLTLFQGVYAAVIFPVMSKYFKDDKNILVVSFEKSVKYLTLITLPFAVGTMFYSLEVIQLFYGAEYDPSASVLSILMWTVCLLFINSACINLLNASHKEFTVTKIYLIAALFNVGLNLLIIPYFSYDGAAVTTVLSDSLILILSLYVIIKLGIKVNRSLLIDLGKIIFASLIMGGVLYILNLNIWVAIIVGMVVYFISVFLLKVFDNNDKYVIKEILGRN